MSSSVYPISTIAKLLLISERRVQQLTQEGVIQKTGRNKYDLVSTVQGYIRFLNARSVGNAGLGNVDYHKEKARKTKAEADIAEMTAAKMSGEMVPAFDVKLRWANIASEVCSRMRNVPTRVAPQILGETDERKLKELLLREIDEALTSISSEETVIAE